MRQDYNLVSTTSSFRDFLLNERPLVSEPAYCVFHFQSLVLARIDAAFEFVSNTIE